MSVSINAPSPLGLGFFSWGNSSSSRHFAFDNVWPRPSINPVNNLGSFKVKGVMNWPIGLRNGLIIYIEIYKALLLQASVNTWIEYVLMEKIELVTMWNRVKCVITNCNNNNWKKFVSATQFGISLQHSAKILHKKCYSTLSLILLITRESEDEQRPVVISAHRPTKIRRKLPFTETWIP